MLTDDKGLSLAVFSNSLVQLSAHESDLLVDVLSISMVCAVTSYSRGRFTLFFLVYWAYSPIVQKVGAL